MLNPKELDRLNRIFGSHPRIGWAPSQYDFRGKPQPQYKWAWTPDLLYAGRIENRRTQKTTDSGLIVVQDEPQFDMVRQYPDDRYAVAKWDAPPDPETWRARYADLGYPEYGMYVITDIVLAEGVEPNEAVTLDVIGAIAEGRTKTLYDLMAISQERMDRPQRKHEQDMADLVDEHLPRWESVPGKRGYGVSFGGI